MSKRTPRIVMLLRRDPHCHWCGRLVERNPSPVGGGLENHHATVDHLYSRWDPRRWDPWAGRRQEERTVLACYECNQRRNNEERDLLDTYDNPSYEYKDMVLEQLEQLPPQQRPAPCVLYKFGIRVSWPNPHKVSK